MTLSNYFSAAELRKAGPCEDCAALYVHAVHAVGCVRVHRYYYIHACRATESYTNLTSSTRKGLKLDYDCGVSILQGYRRSSPVGFHRMCSLLWGLRHTRCESDACQEVVMQRAK